ncbi:MAG TPA: putative inorganic carbon transporter subunit DabA [Sulfurovum sp.]|uniref:putative inorganic carbon transporter subunit DabA n=1 Tax=Sulfurovum sp. TaxID=1969726 RepID=UPI002F958B52
MSIQERLNAVKDTVPHYWPIGSFIHHNPLKGFEDLNFKEALDKAQGIFGGKVYMEPSYYVNLYQQGKIEAAALEKNLLKPLKGHGLEAHFDVAKKFLIEISPKWKSFRSYGDLGKYEVDQALYAYLDEKAVYHHNNAWIKKLLKYMTLYEINDALFRTDDKEMIEKEVIEYIARFLDEEQTTLSMADRERGMFNAFKLYEGIEYHGDSQRYVEEALERLKVKDTEAYFLTHILKLHGWAGFIKYRSEDPDYFSQQQYPSSLMDYMAIRLYFELKYLKNKKIHDFELLDAHIEENRASVILKLLKHKGKLPGIYIDDMEIGTECEAILENYISDQLNLDALQLQLSKGVLGDGNMSLTEYAKFVELLRKEEGFVWLKSLEDSYIHKYVDELTAQNDAAEPPVASATFCLDVRSEVIRRSIEQTGPYSTYGAGGFLGLPIAFVEFDKAHEQFLAPAIVKPRNVVFEIPCESYEEYSSKKGISKTSKKILSDLKNNPYTPYIMVEAIGWIFGINLFGKTFSPRKTEKLFRKMKPKKPKTTYTLDKLSADDIERYVKKLHIRILNEVLANHHNEEFTQNDVEALWKHLVFNDELKLSISEELIEKLQTHYQITQEDYTFQKEKLAMVGFTVEEKVMYLNNFLTMIGQVDHFPEFVTIIGHGSVSDNNPFESALDCGACGGNISLPNTRALCMIANTPEVREKLREDKGIDIPEGVKFIPGIHTTTTDTIKFYDTDILTEEEMKKFGKVMADFNMASAASRDERATFLPNTHTQEDMMIKSMDWSEPRPEWGLAGNMGVFAGPRSSSRHITFNNRLFMHSYDWTIDNENADILTRIFDGPLIVGEWINLEHYFSTVDNRIYGAGSKVYHNVVAKVGVYNGNYSDLKIGLPTQSVLLEGEAYHEPVRLLSFIEAPLEKVGKAVENSIAKTFILNEWIRPVIIDKEAKKVYAYESGEFIVIKELP